MANATWPNGLPQILLKDGYGEKPGENTIETPVDSGPAKSRRRGTARVRHITASLLLTASERSTFETFHDSTLADGSLPFDWVHPLTQAAATFMFRKPHWTIAGVKGIRVLVQLTLEKMP